jgi:filamentous hemagglutinin family protein
LFGSSITNFAEAIGRAQRGAGRASHYICAMGSSRTCLRRTALLGGAAMAAILAATAPAVPGDILRGNLTAAQLAAVAAAQHATTSQQAANLAAQSNASMLAQAMAIRTAQMNQATAIKNAPITNPVVPNGLLPGGLVPDSGLASNGVANPVSPTTWINVGTPTQTTSAGQTTVSVLQTAPQAIATWSSFNIGSSTTLDIEQQSASWTLLNRVMNSGIAPTMILGHIQALGAVYVIDRNGIIFGAGSQVNTHALIASTLDVGDPSVETTLAQRNAWFLNSGIASQAGGTSTAPRQAFSLTAPTAAQIAAGGNLASVGGDVTVQAGASIATTVVSPDSPGFAYLFAANVKNQGAITVPEGEVAMVAAQGIALTPGSYSNPFKPSTASGSTQPVTGFLVNYPQSAGSLQAYLTGSGTVQNDSNAIVTAQRGTVAMIGQNVNQYGVISADTSITRHSAVYLDAIQSVHMAGTISILPYNDGTPFPLIPNATSNGSTVQSFTPPSVEMSAFDISLDTYTDPQSNATSTALIVAPGATVNINAISLKPDTSNPNALQFAAQTATVAQQVTMASGSIIDVSGLQDVLLPASYDIVSFQPRGPEFADDPLQRSGPLNGTTIYVNINNTGTLSNGTSWIGTPVANASGYVGLVNQSIQQLLTKGGSVNISTTLDKTLLGGSDIDLAQGSIINVRGGYVEHQAGTVNDTVLLAAGGAQYDISQADPSIQYTKVKTVTTFEPDYIEGADSGGITIATLSPTLNGTMDFGAVIGVRQIVAGLAPTGTLTVDPVGPFASSPYGLFNVGVQASVNSAPPGLEMPSQGYLSLVAPVAVNIVNPNNANDVVPGAFNLSGDMLSADHLSALNLIANKLTVQADGTVSLAPGGSFIARTAGTIDIEGTIAVPGGNIALTTDNYGVTNVNGGGGGFAGVGASDGRYDITIGQAGTLYTAGIWSNDSGVADGAMTGPGFINGGAISLVTDNANGNSVAGSGGDATGSIIIAAASTTNPKLFPGALLDAVSGGYVNQKGAIKTVAPYVPAGQGGNITLATYQGTAFPAPNSGSTGPTPPTDGSSASINIGGTLASYGFSNGGKLTINTGAAMTQIGGTAPGDPSTLYLPGNLFTQDGFGSFSINAVTDGRFSNTNAQVIGQIEVAGNLSAQQSNYDNNVDYEGVATGTLLQTATLATLPEFDRKPVNLSFAAEYITVDQGAAIQTDPGAAITLATDGSGIGGVLVNGSITDNGGTVSITAPGIWLGTSSVIDLSGTFIENPYFAIATTNQVNGTLLAGGSLTLNAQTVPGSGALPATDFVVAQTGSTVNVSGTSGQIGSKFSQIANAWSDGGTVSINAGTLLWDGTFKAQAGNPLGNNGTLLIGGSTIVVRQNDTCNTCTRVTAGLASQTTATALSLAGAAATGVDFALADTITGFDTVYLAAGATIDGPSGFFNPTSLTTANVSTGIGSNSNYESGGAILFSGSVGFSVRNRLFLEANDIEAGAAGSTTPLTSVASTIAVNATYIGITGTAFGLPTTSGSAKFKATAQTVDLLGQNINFDDFGAVEFDATMNGGGDIRLGASPFAIVLANSVAPTAIGGGGLNPGVAPTAKLQSFGSITFDAERVYPETDVNFTIATGGTVTFNSLNTSATVTESDIPLSAGAALTVNAPFIAQGGNIFVPNGTLVLDGSGSSQTVYSVDLEPGSITSVALGNTVVPFGETEDGKNWFYTLDTNPVTTPPAKSLQLIGLNINVETGAKVDLSGGGDLKAIEFVPGTGGSRDVLSTPSNPTPANAIYALLPSNTAPVAAYDANFAVDLGDAQPLVGQQVYLAGGPGIAAGYYTLYPAHYATLPGALRVTVAGSGLTTGLPPGATSLTEPDGTELIAGYFGQQNIGERSSTPEVFSVQTGSVWKQYSEIDTASAKAYFAAQAAAAGNVTPPLPIDGGQLVVNAQGALAFDGTFSSAAATGGRGGELDVASSLIDLVGSASQDQAAMNAGYVPIQVSQLDDAGFGSILIGGVRSTVATGTLITPTATNVAVDTQGVAFSAPEIILTAKASTTVVQALGQNFNMPVAGTGNVTVLSGSIVEATGSAGTATTNYLVGNSVPFNGSLAAYFAAQLGGTLDSSGNVINGVPFANATAPANLALLTNYGTEAGLQTAMMVSNNPNATLTRTGTMAPATITVNVTGFGAVVLPIAAGTGTISIQGATIGGGDASIATTLALNAPTISIDKNTRLANLNLGTVAISTGGIWFGPATTPTQGFAVGTSTSLALAQLSGVANLDLKAYTGGIEFDGSTGNAPVSTISLAPQNLTLDAGYVAGTGNLAVALDAANSITLTDTGAGASTTAATVAGSTLDLTSKQIDFGGGTTTVAGFGTVSLSTSQQVEAKGAGAITFGADATPVAVDVSTPVFVIDRGTAGSVGSGTQFVLTTLGDYSQTSSGGAGSVTGSAVNIGGSLQITANDILLSNSAIQALSGKVFLTATGADPIQANGTDAKSAAINIDNGGMIDVGGFAQVFFPNTAIEKTVYSGGGQIALTVATGDIFTATGSVLNASEPTGGLAGGGEIDIIAPLGTASLNGAIQATGPTDANGTPEGAGGTFRLLTHGAASLDALATTLGNGGVTGTIDIETGTGNLVLDGGSTLKAQNVTLSADDSSAGNGQVLVNGTIDARGFVFSSAPPGSKPEAGGTVNLFGYNWFSMNSSGRINASTANAGQNGGSVTIGIAAGAPGVGSGAAGVIDLQTGSTIDVSAGTGGSGGTVLLRAPIVTGDFSVSGINGGQSLTIAGGNDVQIGHVGSTFTGARSVTIEDVLAMSTDDTTFETLGWNGVIDPAGNPNFYGVTIANFIQGKGLTDGNGNTVATGYQFTGATNRLGLGGTIALQPGLEFDNPDASKNGGNITVASNWNLAAGKVYTGTTTTTATVNGVRSTTVTTTTADSMTVAVTAPVTMVNGVPACNAANCTTTTTETTDPTTGFTTTTTVTTAGGTIGSVNGTTVQNAAELTSGFYYSGDLIDFDYRYNLEPAAFTFRAAKNVNVNASISDGFFQTQNYEAASYQSALATYETTTVAGIQHTIIGEQGSQIGSNSVTLNSWAPLPLAPYDSTANTASPTSEQLAGADLFPNGLNVYNFQTNTMVAAAATEGSSSYRLTAGTNFGSANPNAVGLASNYVGTNGGTQAGTGNVVIGANLNSANNSYAQGTGYSNGSAATSTVYLPTMIRTGTGDIDVTAAADVSLVDKSTVNGVPTATNNTAAPGVIYSAGVNEPLLADPGFSYNPATGVVTASNTAGFLEPQLLDCYAFCTPAGPPTAAAYPVGGGNITITAGEDVIGYQNVTAGNDGKTPRYQFYMPWLYSAAQEAPGGTGVGAFGFAANFSAKAGSGTINVLPIQSSWWIQYGGFDQGVMSGGGDVTVIAGRDMRDFSVSLPSTGRVSGGLDANTATVIAVYDSGNMDIQVGRNLYSGSFYEGSGTATIAVGGSVSSDWSGLAYNNGGSTQVPVSTVLAVDGGQLALTATGAITISAIVNPAALHVQNYAANPIPSQSVGLLMDTYGPNSAVSVISVGGNITIQPDATQSNSPLAPRAAAQVLTEYTNSLNQYTPPQFAPVYPGTLNVTSVAGNIATPRDVVLADTNTGELNLMAYGTLDLTQQISPANASSQANVDTGIFSAGASLIDTQFDPYEPNNGNNQMFSTPLLTHSGSSWTSDQVAHLFAATGDILGGAQLELNRPAEIAAGRDIVDLNVVIQNLQANDVSAIFAGRNLYYTGTNIGEGIEIAGPGYLDVEAGGNLGPFLPPAFDKNGTVLTQQGITSVGNEASLLEIVAGGDGLYHPFVLPVGNDAQLQTFSFIGEGSKTFVPDSTFTTQGSYIHRFTAGTTGQRDLFLTAAGSNIVAKFGVSKGQDYQAVKEDYIDPNGALSAANQTALQNFLTALGVSLPAQPAAPCNSACQLQYEDSVYSLFTALPASLQNVFVDQVFFSTLRSVGDPTNTSAYRQSQVGYAMVNTLYPASYGYTANSVAGGTNGASSLVETGDLNLLHSTIQSDWGGNVMLFGPGGNILVGTTATESNPNLKLNNLGILTLDGGGVDTFTDGNVEVNESRVFTEQGGDIVMWTSNGNLDAGKGAKTTASFPPLSVNFDQEDLQTINLDGFVTGAGIGTLGTVQSNVILLAPRGTINAGDAGIRSSGNISVIGHVEGAGNIQAGGSQTGVVAPPAASAGTLAAAGNTAGSSSSAGTKVNGGAGQGGPQSLPSIITVEVLGYGGGDSGSAGDDNNKKRQN